MARGPGELDAIHRVAALSPERALLGAAIRQAVEDAARGDADAAEWLAGPVCRSWLHLIAPDGADGDELHRLLLARLPQRAPPGGASSNGATDECWQAATEGST